jgi:hypothetical protein
VAGRSEIAAKLAEEQAEIAVTPDTQGLERFEEGHDKPTVEVLVKCAEQRRDKAAQLLANDAAEEAGLR